MKGRFKVERTKERPHRSIFMKVGSNLFTTGVIQLQEECHPPCRLQEKKRVVGVRVATAHPLQLSLEFQRVRIKECYLTRFSQQLSQAQQQCKEKKKKNNTETIHLRKKQQPDYDLFLNLNLINAQTSSYNLHQYLLWSSIRQTQTVRLQVIRSSRYITGQDYEL